MPHARAGSKVEFLTISANGGPGARASVCHALAMANGDRLVLLRHGETEWSRTMRHTGRTDVPLTPLGEREAAAARPALARWRFAAVLTSPLGRARHTAELAGFSDARVDDDLIEWDYGELEGRTTAELREQSPGWTIWDGPPPGGERLEDVATRVDRVIQRVLAVDGDVLCVAHGHLLRTLTARWAGLAPIDARRFLLGTAAISVLGWEREERAVERTNDQHHLAGVD